MTDTSMLDTITVAAAPSQGSLEAAERARADSGAQVRLLARDAAIRTRADSIELASMGLRDELAGLIHFEFDRSGIQPADRTVLDRKAAILIAGPRRPGSTSSSGASTPAAWMPCLLAARRPSMPARTRPHGP
jgi:hypothetical protein